jgi:prepilin-type N-terminal cleavage/methylation domain-containing protein
MIRHTQPGSPRAGFTYVELTVVVTIIAILAAIAVPNFLGAQIRTVGSRSRAELAVLGMAIEAYRGEHRSWPRNREAWKSSGWDLAALTTPVVYLSQMPMDVFTSADYRGRNRTKGIAPISYRYFNAGQINPDGLTLTSPGGGLPRISSMRDIRMSWYGDLARPWDIYPWAHPAGDPG